MQPNDTDKPFNENAFSGAFDPDAAGTAVKALATRPCPESERQAKDNQRGLAQADAFSGAFDSVLAEGTGEPLAPKPKMPAPKDETQR